MNIKTIFLKLNLVKQNVEWNIYELKHYIYLTKNVLKSLKT